MESTSVNNMTKKKLCKARNNSRPPKKQKFSFNEPSKFQSNSVDDFKRKVVTGINSPKSNSFKSRNTLQNRKSNSFKSGNTLQNRKLNYFKSRNNLQNQKSNSFKSSNTLKNRISNSFKSRNTLKNQKSNSQKISDEEIVSVKPVNTINNSKKLKFSSSKVSQTNFKNAPMFSQQLKNKAKKAKKHKLPRSGLENTSKMLNDRNISKSKKAKRNLKSLAQDLNKNEDKDNLRDDIRNSSIFQKIQKLTAKTPLNPTFKKSKIASGSEQNIEDSNSEDITDDSSDVSFNGISADSNDEDSSSGGEESDSRILNSNLQSCSKDNSMTTSKKQNILIAKSHENMKFKMSAREETSIKKDFERSKKSVMSTNFKDKIRDKLAVAKFRLLNEKLYTETGKEAFKYFNENNDEFEDYHLGYRQQVSKWPMNPVNEIISDLQNLKKNVVIADLGCGEAKIAQVFPNKTVHSFDLVPLNEHVKACDISKVPLPNESVDVAVFCLSLMGINLKDYLCEAFRILKVGGTLKIAEVESRIENLEHFIKYLKSIGFALENKNTKHKMFVFLDLKKEKKYCKQGHLPNFSLRPCLYKKR